MNGRNVPLPQTSAGQHYLVMSLAALAVILLVLLQAGMGRWSFLPVLMGLLGVTLRWRITPLLTLILLAGLLAASEPTNRPGLPRYRAGGSAGDREDDSVALGARVFSLSDWLLCGAVLALCAAQYRMQGMAVSIFPVGYNQWRQDLRDTPAGRSKDRPRTNLQQRGPQLVSPLEIGWLVLSLPIWAFLAQLCWRWVPAGAWTYGLTRQAWRGIVLAWLLGVAVLAVAGLLSYVSLRRLQEREARLCLQDAFWQETGREQRRLGRWLAWAGLRQRRKEKR